MTSEIWCGWDTIQGMKVLCRLLIQLTLFFGCLSSYAQQSDTRVALVLGNGAYKDLIKLENPTNDARAISSQLAGLGFAVTTVENVNRPDLLKALEGFKQRAKESDLALIYYSGHGFAVDGEAYLIPVDAEADSQSKLLIASVGLRSVLDQYVPSKKRLVLYDADIDNPFSSEGHKGSAPMRSVSETLIAYGTGGVAEDGHGSNGQFTAALLAHLEDKQDIAVVLRAVREEVIRNTSGRQRPWVSDSLTGGPLLLPSTNAK